LRRKRGGGGKVIEIFPVRVLSSLHLSLSPCSFLQEESWELPPKFKSTLDLERYGLWRGQRRRTRRVKTWLNASGRRKVGPRLFLEEEQEEKKGRNWNKGSP